MSPQKPALHVEIVFFLLSLVGGEAGGEKDAVGMLCVGNGLLAASTCTWPGLTMGGGFVFSSSQRT